MTLNEDAIEQLAIERLVELGYDYRHGPDIAHDGENPERSSYADVVLAERLRSAVARINPNIPAEAHEQTVKTVLGTHAPELLAANEAFHKLLTDGVEVEFQQDGETRGEKVWVVDFDNPEANDCLVCNQFTIVENNADSFRIERVGTPVGEFDLDGDQFQDVRDAIEEVLQNAV